MPSVISGGSRRTWRTCQSRNWSDGSGSWRSGRPEAEAAQSTATPAKEDLEDAAKTIDGIISASEREAALGDHRRMVCAASRGRLLDHEPTRRCGYYGRRRDHKTAV